MHVEIFLLPENLSGNICVLIDVLRATSTIATALSNGAESVIPVFSLDEARKYRSEGCLICGERGGVKPEDFDLGNSPLEYTRNIVEGKKIVLTTTNGTKALKKLNCKKVIAASFLNARAVYKYLENSAEDTIYIVCAGTNGEFSLEDFLLSGYFAKLDKNPVDLTWLALKYFKTVNDVYEEIKKSSHAQKLFTLGFEEDVHYCSNFGILDVIPIYEPESGNFKLLK